MEICTHVLNLLDDLEKEFDEQELKEEEKVAN